MFKRHKCDAAFLRPIAHSLFPDTYSIKYSIYDAGFSSSSPSTESYLRRAQKSFVNRRNSRGWYGISWRIRGKYFRAAAVESEQLSPIMFNHYNLRYRYNRFISSIISRKKIFFCIFNHPLIRTRCIIIIISPSLSETASSFSNETKEIHSFRFLSSFLSLLSAFPPSYLYRALFFTFTPSMMKIERNLFAILPSSRSARQEFNFRYLRPPVQWISVRNPYVCRLLEAARRPETRNNYARITNCK